LPHPTRDDAVIRVVPRLDPIRDPKRFIIDEFHVGVSLARIPSLERADQPDPSRRFQ
jgi:hypothetical protein